MIDSNFEVLRELINEHDHDKIRAHVEQMDMSARTPFGFQTPLASAIFAECDECVELFLTRGAMTVETLTKLTKIHDQSPFALPEPEVNTESPCYQKVNRAYFERRHQLWQWMRAHNHDKLSYDEMSAWSGYDLNLRNVASQLGCRECMYHCIPIGDDPDKAITQGRATMRLKEWAKTDPTINIRAVAKYFVDNNARYSDEALKSYLQRFNTIHQFKMRLGDFPYTKPILECCATLVLSGQSVEQVALSFVKVRKDIIATCAANDERSPDTEEMDSRVIARLQQH